MSTLVQLSLILSLGCQTEDPKDNNRLSEDSSAASDEPITPMDVNVFAAICKEELGLPSEPLPPMNCLDGIEVPILIDGVPVNEENYAMLAAGEIGCDHPSWLNSDEPCSNYSFVNRYELSDDVTAMLFCRKKKMSSHLSPAERYEAYAEDPSREKFEALFFFDTIGLIWTNNRTGKTCFFDNKNPNFFAGYIPSPEDKRLPQATDLPNPAPPEELLDEILSQKSTDIWRRPIDTRQHARCNICHDSAPFVHTPHLNSLNIVPPTNPSLPYQIIMAGIGEETVILEAKAISTTDVQGEDGPEPQVCTSCHHIGNERSCELFVSYYTGQMTAPGQREGMSFHERVLMPPYAYDDLSEEEAETLWLEKYQHHLDKLLCCCEQPDALGCQSKDLTVGPGEGITMGEGPHSCEP